jgi:formylglycine-generating enzyme required for sulfatase activity
LKSLSLGVCVFVAASLWMVEAKTDESGQSPNSTADLMLGKEPAQVRDDNDLKTKLVWCPPGEFKMGSPKSEEGRDKDEDQMNVKLTKGFWLGKFEVTQEEWEKVIGTTPWKGKEYVKEAAKFPATYVSWDDAVAFCEKLTRQERAAGRLPGGWKYTLPTEAQWEYACRAGTTTRYSFGDDDAALSDYAWWDGIVGDGNAKTEQYAHQVGTKKANPWGLHDMYGNVWEWCRDVKVAGLPGGTDPEVTAEGSDRIYRGGGWLNDAVRCRSAYRGGNSPDLRFVHLGFRLALCPIQ